MTANLQLAMDKVAHATIVTSLKIQEMLRNYDSPGTGDLPAIQKPPIGTSIELLDNTASDHVPLLLTVDFDERRRGGRVTPVDISTALSGGLEIVQKWWLPFMIGLAAVGVISMALIQAAKDLFPIHRWFHRSRLTAWLGAQSSDSAMPGALDDLLTLATSGNANALYDLSISKLMAQVSMAARVALVFRRTTRRS